jgi:hypothetical protein
MPGLNRVGYRYRSWAHIFDCLSASYVSDAIERTHRLTGVPRYEIVRRGLQVR